MLKLENIQVTLNKKPILKNICFSMSKGSIAILLGPSGVGKSTLLRVLNNLEQLDSGKLYVDGQEVTPELLRKNHSIGMVFQQFNLFDHLTVENNITLALKAVKNLSKTEAHTKANALLTFFDLQNKASLPIKNLSGGQKQRLAIAREMALDRKIICFDEPTSALDPGLTNQIAKSIETLANQGYYILVTTHDTTLLEKLPATMYLMKAGSIVEQATTQAFFKNKKAYPLLHAFVQGHESKT